MAAPKVQPNSWRVFAIAAAAATAATIAFALVLQFQPGGDTFVTAVDDIGEAVAALLAAAACAWTASRSVGSLRRGWVLMAASASAWCIGELVWSCLLYTSPSPRDRG